MSPVVEVYVGATGTEATLSGGRLDLLSQPLTDSGNGERFVKLHGQDVRYCPEYRAWFVWDGKQWKRDANGRVHRMAKETARRLYVDALKIAEKEEGSKVDGFARNSENVRGIKALGGHLKTGHSWPPENRPLATKRDGGFYSFACG
jgi:D5 N terminal like